MKTEPDAIKPAVRGKADFFSWQLYLWTKKNPHLCQIWKGTWNSATGIDRNKPVLYIGVMDTDDKWFHGRMLRNVCCHGQKLDSFAYGPSYDTATWEEVTDEWWAEYMRIGVCAIHGDYAHKWRETKKARVCDYCGKAERKVTEMVPRIRWVDYDECKESEDG